jgi:alkylhydroperoxidase family enzyme
LLRSAEGQAKVRGLATWETSDAFSETERLAIAFADGITRSDRDVDDELFAGLRESFTETDLVQLAAWICLENFYSKFNRAFRVEAQGFCLVETT